MKLTIKETIVMYLLVYLIRMSNYRTSFLSMILNHKNILTEFSNRHQQIYIENGSTVHYSAYVSVQKALYFWNKILDKI